MLMLYAGFPGALEGLRVLNATWPGRARRTFEGVPATWRRRGLALCRRVYGPAIARLLPAVRALHPALGVWMVEHGYGRVLARPGLGARERELVTVSALGALGWERQLVSHVLGAFRIGALAAEVREALAIGARAGGQREREIAGRTWDRARRLQDAQGGGLARTRQGGRLRGSARPVGRERTRAQRARVPRRVARRRSASN